MSGPLETTSATFAGGTATYSFTNLPTGDYMLFTDQTITLGANEYVGKSMPERVVINEAADIASGGDDNSMAYNFTIASATSGTTVTVRITGGIGKALDVFAGSPTGFKVKQVTPSASPEDVTLKLADGQWFVGVGPQMPKGPMGGPPPAPDYLPPKPEEVKVVAAGSPAVTETSGTANDAIIAFALTSASKSIRGIVQDGAGKIMANAEVFAYSPQGGFGTHAQSDSAGAFTLSVANGSYVVGAFIPGMPPSKEVSVIVTADATTYLLVEGATTAISPATAATTFILKVAKPDYTISGKVTDGTNAVQGASVYAYRTDGPGNANANTDSSGNYTLYVSNGAWKVGAFLPQYGNLAELTITVNGASASNQNFTPSTTGTFRAVSGTVTSGGAAVQGAFVKLSGNGMSNETITGSDGTYSFKVPVGTGYVIRAFIPGVGESAPLSAFDVAGADITGKDITVATPRTITVTFSASVAKAFVDIFSTNGVGNHADVNNATTATLSLSNGTYQVRVNIPGIVIGLTDVAGTGGASYNNTTGIVTVTANGGLTVQIPANLRTITGTVTDGTNNIANAWVEVMNPTAGIHSGTQTDSTGAFSIKVVDGTYFINAMKPGFFREPSSVIVSATTSAQTITISAATTTISGQILIGSSGASNAFVRAEKQGGGFSGTQADTSGNYSLPVSSGVWRIYAVAEGYQEAALTTNPVDVTAGSVSGKNITLTTTVGVNAPKSKPITPASGGTLEDATAGVKITVPANALGTSTSAGNIQAKETSNVRPTNTAQPLKSFDSSTNSYAPVAKTISATDNSGNAITTLNDTVTVEMTYTKAELAASESGADASINTKTEADKLVMAYWDTTNQNWSPLASSVTYKDSNGAIIAAPSADLSDVSTVTIAAPTDHLSDYAPISSTDPSAPATPSGLAISSATTESIAMTWTVVGGATSYDIYRSSTSGGTFARLGSEPTVASGSTTTYTDSGLAANTTYYYKITSLNASGESAASSEVAMTTSAVVSTPSGSGYIAPPTSITQPTVTTEVKKETTVVTNPVVETSPITQIVNEAAKIATANTEAVAGEVGKSRDVGIEQRYESTIVARIVVANTPAATRAKVLNFVTYGTNTTQVLGAGERGGVVNSFRAAYGKVPESEADWQDVLKIANGRWPSTLSTARESAVSATFKKIYLRDPIRSNARDDAAVTVMAYGLRPAARNLNSEKVAINTYKAIFRKAPTQAADWDTVRAIAYSGAKR